MTDAEHNALVIDYLTTACEMAKALVGAMVELKKRVDTMQNPADAGYQQQIDKLKEELLGCRQALGGALREVAEARADRDKAEAHIVKMQAELRQLRRPIVGRRKRQ